MKFFELDTLHQVGMGACSFEPVAKIKRLDPPLCDVCGAKLGPLRRIPPYTYKMTSKHVADVVTDGGVFAVSPRFIECFSSSGLTGLEFSKDAITITNSSATFYMAHPPYTYTLIDTEASGAVLRTLVGCAKCGVAAYYKIDRIVIREDTWPNADVFMLSGLMGVVLVTERLVDFVHANQLTGFSFLNQDSYHYDYTSVFER